MSVYSGLLGYISLKAGLEVEYGFYWNSGIVVKGIENDIFETMSKTSGFKGVLKKTRVMTMQPPRTNNTKKISLWKIPNHNPEKIDNQKRTVDVFVGVQQ